jgi:hypothetical protein
MHLWPHPSRLAQEGSHLRMTTEFAAADNLNHDFTAPAVSPPTM